jgi:transposase
MRHHSAKSLADSKIQKEESKMKDTTIAVDLAKNVFEIAVSDRPGRVVERKRVSRKRFVTYFAQRQPARVLLEACGSAHHWGRELRAMGHEVVLLPPQYVRAYVPRNKTDRSDAKALLEAYRNEDLKPVPIKSVDQQCVALLHRMRSAWMATRVARLNAVRGMLRELGIVIPVGASQVLPALRTHLLKGAVPMALTDALEEMIIEIEALEARIHQVERELEALSKQLPVVDLLRTIPGIGLLTATALVAFVGDVYRFPSGRHLASYLGLTPRERSSGGVQRLGKMSKRGDVYLRMMLIHGARAVLRWAVVKEPKDRLRCWALERKRERGHNKAAVALANKMARIVWAVWRRGEPYCDAL